LQGCFLICHFLFPPFKYLAINNMYIWKNEQKWTLKNPEDFSSGLAYVRSYIILIPSQYLYEG